MIQLVSKFAELAKISKPGDRQPQHLGEERRRDGGRSLSLFWKARVRIADFVCPAMVVQISPSGMRVRHPEPPEPGTMITIELPGLRPLSGEVRWNEGDRFGVLLDDKIDVISAMRRHRAATGTHLGVDCDV